MKKLFVLISLIVLTLTSCEYSTGDMNRITTKETQDNNLANALAAYPVPVSQNFLERKTISDWVKRWDKTDIACYTYFFIGDNCIGYFVSHGKPASTQSYLIPEDYTETHRGQNGGGNVVREAPDLDGTYGTNNPGYRFFMANGTAVEVSGTMVSCVYSDAPLTINCPEIKAIGK